MEQLFPRHHGRIVIFVGERPKIKGHMTKVVNVVGRVDENIPIGMLMFVVVGVLLIPLLDVVVIVVV